MAVKEAAPRYRRINLPSLDELFLGWTKGLDTSRDFCWRQLRDMNGSALVELMAPITLAYYARLCGWTLARDHAQSGNPVSTAEYLGGGSTSTGRSPTSANATPTRTSRTTWSSSRRSGPVASKRSKVSEHPLIGPPPGPPGPSVTGRLSTIEVRWILPGQLDAAIARWFGRFPAGLDSREDTYLIHPLLRGLAVKIRAGQMLEVKQYHGSPGILDAAGRARGRIESWRKWSFPFGPLGPDNAGPPSWVVVL